MEAKFSKGPWQNTPPGPADANGMGVCSMWGCDTDEEMKANAHLIAAAPEMYEALDNFDAYASTDVDYIGSPFQKEVRAALAKARGES